MPRHRISASSSRNKKAKHKSSKAISLLASKSGIYPLGQGKYKDNSQDEIRGKIYSQPKVISSKIKLLVGCLFIFLSIVFAVSGIVLPRLNSTNQIVNSFAEEPLKVDVTFTGRQTGSLPKRIIIPSLQIDIPIKLSPVENGYWVVWEKEAGFGQGGAAPGEAGNTVIFAHSTPDLFGPLKDINIGSNIYILGQDKYYEYSVVEIKTVMPHEVQVVSPTEDERLTLYTCSGVLDQKRLIVISKPIEQPI
jgi:LPXTG-site transpeptidase (sortase) family protein